MLYKEFDYKDSLSATCIPPLPIKEFKQSLEEKREKKNSKGTSENNKRGGKLAYLNYNWFTIICCFSQIASQT